MDEEEGTENKNKKHHLPEHDLTYTVSFLLPLMGAGTCA
jgi:hypothetical protein